MVGCKPFYLYSLVSVESLYYILEYKLYSEQWNGFLSMAIDFYMKHFERVQVGNALVTDFCFLQQYGIAHISCSVIEYNDASSLLQPSSYALFFSGINQSNLSLYMYQYCLVVSQIYVQSK